MSEVSEPVGVVLSERTTTASELQQRKIDESLGLALLTLLHVTDVLDAVATKHMQDFELAGAKRGVVTVV